MALPKLLTKLDGFALLMAGSLGAIAFAMTLHFIELEAFQTKDYVFPVIVMLYLYTRNAHRFTEEPAAAPPPCDEPPLGAPPSESRAPPSSSMRCARHAGAGLAALARPSREDISRRATHQCSAPRTVTQMPRSLSYVKGPNIRWGEGVVVLVFWASLGARTLPSSHASPVFIDAASVQATWCEFCKKSLQPLDSVARRYAERGVQMLAVTREDTEDVDEFLAKMKRVLSMAVAVDQGSALTQRCATSCSASHLPTSRVAVRECTLSPPRLQDEFAESTIPHVYAVNATGEIAWHGHPAALEVRARAPRAGPRIFPSACSELTAGLRGDVRRGWLACSQPRGSTTTTTRATEFASAPLIPLFRR